MIKTTLFSLLAIISVMAVPFQMALGQVPPEPAVPDKWATVGPGIEYQLFHLTDPRPINVYVARMDRNDPSVTIDSSIGQGRLSGGLEKVRDMNARYDQAVNYWGKTWGGRNRVVVGINGYFFEQVGDSVGVPLSGQIHSGWYSKQFTDHRGDAGFMWTLNREAQMASCVFNDNKKNYITFESAGSYDPSIRGINIARESEELILYTSQYDSNTRTETDGDTPTVEILVEMERPAGILPAPNGARGYIRNISIGRGDTPLYFGYVVISAWGDVGTAIKNRINDGVINNGDEIRINQEISTCGEGSTIDWTNTYAAIGGNCHFLSNGLIQLGCDDVTVPNSYTAIVYNQDYVYYIVADKQYKDVSEGISVAELAEFSQGMLAGKEGVTLDGGGSTTMVINGEVINDAHCNFTDDCKDGVIDDQPVEPLVANGMMMVVALPKEQSTSFTPGDEPTVSETEIRLGPGTNYPIIDYVTDPEDGTILSTLYQTEGVLAKGSYWWLLDFNSHYAGWVKEESIIGGQTPPSFEAFIPLVSSSSQAAAQNVIRP
jgi:hypothetical protein